MEVFQCDTSGQMRARETAERRLSLKNYDDWDDVFIDDATTGGMRVTRDTALKIAGFFRGVQLISARIAELPLYVYREKADNSYAVDRTHRANKLIRLSASAEVTALNIKHTLQSHALTHGNGFAYAPQNGAGVPEELLVLLPDRTRLTRIKGRLRYVTAIGGTLEDSASELRYIDPDEIVHIRGLGWDGFSGYSVIRMGREVLGGALSAQQYGNAFFANGAAVGLVLETDKELGDVAYGRMKSMWHKTRAGLKSAHKAAILEDGVKAKTLSLSARDAQLIESKQFDLALIEQLLGLPPGKLSGLRRAGSVEADNQEFVDDCLGWWLTQWETECSRKLLSVSEYESETCKIQFDRKQLTRSNLAAQAMWWRTALGGRPWATPLEARQATGLDPTKGEDNILEPLNMGSLQASADGGTLKSQYGDSAIAATTKRDIVAEAVGRMAKRVSNFVERSAGKPATLLSKFDADHAGVVREALSLVSPLTRENGLAEWFLSAIRQPLQAIADGEPATSADSLATFVNGLPARAVELV